MDLSSFWHFIITDGAPLTHGEQLDVQAW